MSRHVRSRSVWKIILGEDEKSAQPVEPVVGQQPSDEQPQQEQSPPETQDITPDEEQGAAGAPEDEGTDLETDFQELAKPITGREGGDGPELIGHTCANQERVKMLETEEGKPVV